MGQSERGRESFIILEAEEDGAAAVEASVTKTTHIYLLSGFICAAQKPRNPFVIR